MTQYNKNNLFSIILVLLCSTSMIAQDINILKKHKAYRELDLLYNFGHIGHNVSLNYTHYFGTSRHAITAGLKYHLETEIHNKSSQFDGWTFYRDSYDRNSPLRTRKSFLHPIVERLGINLGYKYCLIKSPVLRSTSPYLFYQLQATLGMQATIYPPGPSYISTERFTIWENVVGVGIQPQIYKKLLANISVGAGATRINWYGDGIWEKSFVARLGLTYPIGKRVIETSQ